MSDIPDDATLRAAASEALAAEVLPGLEGRARFVAAMVGNALGQAAPPPPVPDLAAAIRAGRHDADAEIYAALRPGGGVGGAARFRRATAADLPAIVALLADDPLGIARESAAPAALDRYRAAFAAIDADPNQILCVAERDGRVLGTLQLTLIPGLSRQGAMRGQIEAVRVATGSRGEGLGETMLRWAIATCRVRGCALVQLTTDRTRADAHRFYERLGFSPSHLGYKLTL